MSLRARLMITTVALVAAGLIVANVATYRALSSSLLRRVDDELAQSRALVYEALSQFPHPGDFGPSPGDVTPLPPGAYGQLRDGTGKVINERTFGYGPVPTPVVPAEIPGLPPGSVGTSTFETTGEGGDPEYRCLATSPNGQVTLIVAVPLTDVSSTLDRLIRIEVVVSLLVLALVGGFAWWLVRVGLRPLEGIGETAGAIAAGDLTQRVEPADARTEVGRLGLSLNAMLAQIETAFEERRASEARLRRFVADASHELRTPLTSIRGYAELFRRGASSRPEDLAKSMTRIEAEAARMGVMVDDLLLLARLDQGRALEREPVDLGAVAADAVEGARAVDPDRPLDLSLDGDVRLSGDAGRLRQVVDNLLDNARVHTPAGTPVHVRVAREGNVVVLTVVDEGPGLQPEVAARVFERFYRGDPARSRETGGAGLGLSIVAAIVEEHGGSVDARAADGGGTALEARFPGPPLA